MKFKSFAKINLSLEVLGKHDNNYHEIKGIFQNINLYDVIKIEEARIDIVTTKNVIIEKKDNLVDKILKEFKNYFKIKNNFHIEIIKNIPLSSGLGGGSSNAASVIINLNNYLNLNLNSTELKSFVAKFGSDIPFFIDGGTCAVSGKGEIVRKIDDCVNIGVILSTPEVLVSNKTEKNFSLITKKDFSDGKITDQLKEKILIKSVLEDVNLFNIFNSLVINKYPEVKKVAEQMNNFYGSCLLSGAGMSLFTLKTDKIINETGLYYSLVNKGWDFID